MDVALVRSFVAKAIFLLLTVCSVATAQLTNVDLKLVDGSTSDGSILSIDVDGKLVGKGLPAGLSLQDILSIESQKKSEIQTAFSVSLYTINGGRLLIRNPTINSDAVMFESASRIATLPLQNLRAIVWTTSANIEKQLLSPSAADDTVIVDTNDGERSVTGIVEGLSGEQLQLNYQNESRKIGVGKIKAVIMADLGLAPPAGPLATIALTDGSTIAGAVRTLTGPELTIELSNEKTVVLDSAMVVSISIPSDRRQYLSDLQPLDVQQRTEFTVQRSWRADRSVENNPLTIRVGKTDEIKRFNKGLGTQAFTQLDYANANNFSRFQATVGIDSETEGRGDCQMVVRGDGIELWSERIRGNGIPVDVDLDIDGMQVISLLVYPGEEFDLADHADWGNARFVK